MKKITFHSFLLILVVLGFVACNTEENVMPKTENGKFKKIRIEDNIVSFNSMEHFSEFLKKANQRYEFLSEFKEQFPSFKSNFDAYESLNESLVQDIIGNPDKYASYAKIVEDNGEKYLEPIIDDVNIRSVLNESGFVKISNNYYKFTYERVFISENLSDLGNNNSRRMSSVESIEVSRGNNESMRRPNEDCRYDYTKKTWLRTLDCRFRGRLWTTNIGALYSGIGANTTHYVKTSGIWFRDNAPMLRLKYDVDYIQYFPTAGNIYLTDSFDSGEVSNVRRIDETFQFCVNTSCNFSFDSADSYHSGRGDANNNFWSCNLNI